MVTSKDGTRIAYEKSGAGPAVILVLGAFNERSMGTPLSQALNQHFTVVNYDRRGLGESGDTAPYYIGREVTWQPLRMIETGHGNSRHNV